MDLQFIKFKNFGIAYRPPHFRLAVMDLNIKDRYSYLDFTDTVVHEFAYVLETMEMPL